MPPRPSFWSPLRTPGLLVLLVFLAVMGAVWSLNQQLLQSQREHALSEARQLLVGQARTIREDFQTFREAFLFSLTNLNYPVFLSEEDPPSSEILPIRRFLALNQPLLRSILLVPPREQASEITFEKAGYFTVLHPPWKEARNTVRNPFGAIRSSILDNEGRLICEVRADLNLPDFFQSHLQRFLANHPRHSIHALYLDGNELKLIGSRGQSDLFFAHTTKEDLRDDLCEQYEGTLNHRGANPDTGPLILTVYTPLTLADQSFLLLVSIEENRIFSAMERSWRVIFWATGIFLGLLALVFWLFFRRILSDQREREAALCSLEKSQKDLLQAHSDLEAINRNLQAAMTRAEEAAAAAQRANTAKNEFLAIMSHEIRTPLHGLLGFAELLRDTHLNDEQLGFVRTIQTSGETLLLLLNDLLDFSKIESGRMELHEAPVDLSELLAQAINLQKSAARAKSIRLVQEIAPDCPHQIWADRARLRQILLNLISNAVKFSEAGEILTSVRLSPDLKQVVFSVSDSGCGIPPELQKTIFEPFTQADASSRRTHGGTGLGLAICRKIVTLMGGKIGVESQPGQGSRFHFSIPLNPLPNASSSQASTESAFPPPLPAALADLRVLVAEDNHINQKLLILHLKKAGISPTVVSDGLEALEAATSETFDCILMDFQMPHMDGFEATRRIRENERACGHPPVPIIAVTANVTEEAASRATEAGMTGYLTKPLQARALFDLLITLLPPDEPSEGA